MKTLVVGSTGLTGSEICRSLVGKGYLVRGLVRATSNPEKVNALKALGIEVVVGDLREPALLASACAGVDAVITTVSSMPFSYVPGQNDLQSVDLDGATNLIAAAKEARVRHFIFMSFTGNVDLTAPLGIAKRTVEQRLRDSGMPYTILRPGYFMEVWLSPAVGFDAANAQAQIYGTGDQPISWIALQDVVAFTVAALENPAARNAIIEMGGPAAVSPHQVIHCFEQKTGRKFSVTHVPPEALQAQLADATDPMQQSFISLMLCYAQGNSIEMRETARTYDIHLKSIEQFAQGA
ncbi:MAG: SDR family oxidoreductase [Chloroflexi bacterium]|nr:SDR family oxidoreductase [Chloroflexota bacterium]